MRRLSVAGVFALMVAVTALVTEARSTARPDAPQTQGPILRRQPAPAPAPAPLVPAIRAVTQKRFPRTSPGKFAVLVALDGQLGRGRLTLSPEREIVYNSKVIYNLADDFNKAFVLPRTIFVDMRGCAGQVDTHYNEKTHRILLCDEWVTLDAQLRPKGTPAAEIRKQVVYSAAFAFGHEVGHALIHELNLKTQGLEEDVADQLAVYLLTGTPSGADVALAGADTFFNLAVASSRGDKRSEIEKLWDQADEHSPDARRAFNILCWTYGSDTGRFRGVAGALPPNRAAGCRDEFARSMAAFDSDLRPHFR